MGRIEEILLIIGVGLLFFGPHKMVDFAKGLGASLHEFKKAANPETPAPSSSQVSVAVAPTYAVRRKTHPSRRKAAPKAKKPRRKKASPKAKKSR